MKNLQLLTALCLIQFMGCAQTDNIDPDDDTLGGSFQLSISGDMSQSMKGEAAFSTAF